MTESVLAFSDFVPGSRRGVRKSHRRIFDFKSHVWPSPGPTRTPDLGLSHTFERWTPSRLACVAISAIPLLSGAWSRVYHYPQRIIRGADESIAERGGSRSRAALRLMRPRPC
eukprot:scaffold6383_cov41-Phaeocystis_antarctica.AAC.1